MTCPQDIEINQDYLIAHEQSRINACNIYLRHPISSFEKRHVRMSAKCELQKLIACYNRKSLLVAYAFVWVARSFLA